MAIDFVVVAALTAAAIGYMRKSRDEVSPARARWGLVPAIVGFLLPLVLNQLLASDVLHRVHKLLAFITAFLGFVAWIAALKYTTRRRSSERRARP